MADYYTDEELGFVAAPVRRKAALFPDNVATPQSAQTYTDEELGFGAAPATPTASPREPAKPTISPLPAQPYGEGFRNVLESSGSPVQDPFVESLRLTPGKVVQSTKFGRDLAGALGRSKFSEGYIGRIAEGTRKRLAGEASPPVEEPPEDPNAPGLWANFKKAAAENPGMLLGEFLAAGVHDAPLLLLNPNLFGLRLGALAAKVAGGSGTAAKLAGRAGQALGTGLDFGLVGAGAELAAQTAEPGKPYKAEDVAKSAAMWGAGASVLTFILKGHPGGIPVGKNGKASSESVDAIFAEYEKATGNPDKLASKDVQVVADALARKQNAEADALKNAQETAYNLMQKGASKKVVEATIKRNPLVGQVLEEMRNTRAQMQKAYPKDGPLEGEVLPPEGPPGQPLLPGPPPPAGLIGEGVIGLPRPSGGIRETISPEAQAARDAAQANVEAATADNIAQRLDAEMSQGGGALREGIPLESGPDGLQPVQPQGTTFPTPDVNPRLTTAIEKMAAGRAFDLTAEERIAWAHAGKAKTQPGAMEAGGYSTPEYLMGLGFVASGATVGSVMADDPVAGAAQGAGYALLALTLPRLIKSAPKSAAELAEGLDKGLGLGSTRVWRQSPQIALRWREFEKNLKTNTHNYIERTRGFVEALQGLPEALSGKFRRALLSGDIAAAQQVMRQHGDPALARGFVETRKLLDEVGGDLKLTGRVPNLRDNYFPRIVTDREGLLKSVGLTMRTSIEDALRKAEHAAIRTRGSSLTDVEASIVINRVIRGHVPSGELRPGFSKHRVFDEVTEAMEPFYASVEESLHTYLRNAVNDIEKARFFGRDLSIRQLNGQAFIDTESSIGALLQRAGHGGKLDARAEETIRSILRSRFISDAAPAHGLVQDVKNAMVLGTLGQFVTGLKQTSDIFTVAAVQGLWPTVQAFASRASGRPGILARDFGLIDNIAEEFAGTRASAKAVNKILKWDLLTPIDTFMKDVGLRAAYIKAQNTARTGKGFDAFQRRYEEAFSTPRFHELLDDLRAGRRTEDTDLLVWSELSDMQPISKAEVPQKYLDMPNGRIIYTLKTWMLKQGDLVRNKAYYEFRDGHPRTAAKNLTTYMLALAMSGATQDMIVDWMDGVNDPLEASDVMENMLKTFGWSTYVLEQTRKGELTKAAAEIAMPPFEIFDKVIQNDPSWVSNIPLAGRPYYKHFMGGAEQTEERKAKERAEREDVKYYMTPEERMRRLKKARERRLEKLEK